MESLLQLEKTVHTLLARYDALQAEVRSLREQNVQQRQEMIRTHCERTALQRQHRQLQAAFSMTGNPEQKEKARQQINYLIYLVDKALETLKQG